MKRDCVYYSESIYLKCAVNPMGSCTDCLDYESDPDYQENKVQVFLEKIVSLFSMGRWSQLPAVIELAPGLALPLRFCSIQMSRESHPAYMRPFLTDRSRADIPQRTIYDLSFYGHLSFLGDELTERLNTWASDRRALVSYTGSLEYQKIEAIAYSSRAKVFLDLPSGRTDAELSCQKIEVNIDFESNSISLLLSITEDY